MNPYLVFLLVVLIGAWLIDLLAEWLNLRAFDTTVPKEFEGYYEPGAYRRSQKYLQANGRLDMLSETLLTSLILGFILLGGFDRVDTAARALGFGPIPTGLIFAGILLLFREMIEIPFSAFHTFVIEERYGFNRSTVGTFILDILKGWFLAALIGAPVFGLVLWFFAQAGSWAWLYCWGMVACFQLLVMFIAPVLILPLFNRFDPLQEGELRDAILSYARSRQFKLKGIYTMDASRRSSKSNAFFIGFGRFKRIVLFDTLVARHTVDGVVAVLAHEIGHYKKGHIHKTLVTLVLSTGLMFLLLSGFLENRMLFDAFRMQNMSIYAAIFFFGLLYTPLGLILGVFSNALSRRFEFSADAYAVETCPKPAAFIEALKKLTVENLSNLTPHPMKVFLEYSHPPVLERIHAIRARMRR